MLDNSWTQFDFYLKISFKYSPFFAHQLLLKWMPAHSLDKKSVTFLFSKFKKLMKRQHFGNNSRKSPSMQFPIVVTKVFSKLTSKPLTNKQKILYTTNFSTLTYLEKALNLCFYISIYYINASCYYINIKYLTSKICSES